MHAVTGEIAAGSCPVAEGCGCRFGRCGLAPGSRPTEPPRWAGDLSPASHERAPRFVRKGIWARRTRRSPPSCRGGGGLPGAWSPSRARVPRRRSCARSRGSGERGATVAITAVPGSPVASSADETMVLDFADQQSVVQTRFATTALALLRAHIGDRLEAAIAHGEAALAGALPVEPSQFKQFVSLGDAEPWASRTRRRSTCAQRPPPGPRRTRPWNTATARSARRPRDPAWASDRSIRELADAADTGATIVNEGTDPMAELVLIKRIAVRVAEAQADDPDHPERLTRSVVPPRAATAHAGGPDRGRGLVPRGHEGLSERGRGR